MREAATVLITLHCIARDVHCVRWHAHWIGVGFFGAPVRRAWVRFFSHTPGVEGGCLFTPPPRTTALDAPRHPPPPVDPSRSLATTTPPPPSPVNEAPMNLPPLPWQVRPKIHPKEHLKHDGGSSMRLAGAI